MSSPLSSPPTPPGPGRPASACRASSGRHRPRRTDPLDLSRRPYRDPAPCRHRRRPATPGAAARRPDGPAAGVRLRDDLKVPSTLIRGRRLGQHDHQGRGRQQVPVGDAATGRHRQPRPARSPPGRAQRHRRARPVRRRGGRLRPRRTGRRPTDRFRPAAAHPSTSGTAPSRTSAACSSSATGPTTARSTRHSPRPLGGAAWAARCPRSRWPADDQRDQRDIAITSLTPEPSPVPVKGKLTVRASTPTGSEPRGPGAPVDRREGSQGSSRSAAEDHGNEVEIASTPRPPPARSSQPGRPAARRGDHGQQRDQHLSDGDQGGTQRPDRGPAAAGAEVHPLGPGRRPAHPLVRGRAANATETAAARRGRPVPVRQAGVRRDHPRRRSATGLRSASPGADAKIEERSATRASACS